MVVAALLAWSAATLGACLGGAQARDIYVDGKAGRTGGAATMHDPILTIWAATQIARPCDTVHVAPTVLYERQGIQYLHGAPGCPIRFVGGSGSGDLTQIRSSEANQPPLSIYGASYVEVSRFHLHGRNDDSDCLRASSPNASDIVHHITITGNVFSDCGIDGIDFFQSDYLTIAHNTIFNTSRYTLSGRFGSGISLLANWNTDNSTAPKIFIDSNVIFNASNTPFCYPRDTACFARARTSDGSGIILDANCIAYRYAGGAAPNRFQPCYAGRTVITNNIVMGNGGRGIYVYRSSHITIANNTTYGNNVDPYESQFQPGELEVNNGGDIQLYNNVSVSLGGISAAGKGFPRHCITVQGNTGLDRKTATGPGYVNPNQPGVGAGPITARNNWCHFTNDIGSPHNYIAYYVLGATIEDAGYGNPMLNRLAPDLTADFRPRPGSPILSRTKPAFWNLSTDFLNQPRLPRSALGAYVNTEK